MKWSFSLPVQRFAIFIMTCYEIQSYIETLLSSLKRRSIWDQAELCSSFQSWDIAKTWRMLRLTSKKYAVKISFWDIELSTEVRCDSAGTHHYCWKPFIHPVFWFLCFLLIYFWTFCGSLAGWHLDGWMDSWDGLVWLKLVLSWVSKTF